MSRDDSENFKINFDTSTGKRSPAPQEPTRFTITGIPPSEPIFTVTFNNPSVREAEDPLQTTFQVFIPEDLLQVRRQNVEVYNYGGTSVTAEVCEAPKYCRENKLADGYGWLDQGEWTWHHLLPQEFRALYPRNLDIDAAQYGLVIKENVHSALHWSGWNKSWQDFFKGYQGGQKPTSPEVIDMLNRLCLAYHGVAYSELKKAQNSYGTWGRGKNYVAWNERGYY